MLGLGNLLTKSGVIKKFPNDFSFNFDGSNDHLETASPINVSGDSSRTFSAWIRPDSLPSSGNAVDVIAYGNQSSGQYFEFGIFNDSGTIKAWVNLWGEDVRQAQTFTIGTWYHYAVVFTNSASGQGTIKLYINGSLIHTSGTLGQTNAINTGNTAVGIGYRTSNALYFDGHIDEVAVWNTALDASTIAKLGSKPVDLTKYSAANLKLWLRCGDKAEPESNTAIARQDFSLNFDGTDDFVNTNDSNLIITGTNVTLSAWIRNTDSDSGYFIQSQKGAGSTNLALAVNTDASGESAGKLSAIIWGGSSHSYVTYDASINDSRWHYVALTTTSSAQVLYLDGVAVATGSNTFSNSASSDHTIIGSRGESAGNDFGGSISNVSVYQTHLDAQTIKQFAKSRFTPMRDNRFSVVDFDGTNDYIDCGSFSSSIFSDSYDDGLTLESWFKTDSVSAYQGIVEIGLVSGSHGTLQLMINPDVDKPQLRVNGASDSVLSSTTIVANQWYHVSGVFDGANNELKLYLNGVLSGTTSYSSALDFSTYGRQIDIGRMRNDLEFSGAISSVSIYNIARSESTIYSTYQKGITHNPSADTGLVGLWLMGDDISKAYPTIADSSSNSNDGTITNGASDDIVQQMVAGYDLGAFESTEVLGNELIENGVISTSQFTLSPAYDASTGIGATIDNGTLRIRTTGNTGAYINDDDLLESGSLYKIVAVVSDATAGQLYFRGGDVYMQNEASTVGTHIIYLKTDGTRFIIARDANTVDISISSLSVKKVFQSDLSDTYPAIIDVTEPVLGVNLVDANTNSNWESSGSNTIGNITNGISITYVDNTVGSYAYLRDSKLTSTDLTVGAIYKLTYNAYYSGGSGNPYVEVYNAAVSFNGDAITTTDTSYSIYFNAAGDVSSFVRIQSMSSSNVLYLTNLSLQKVSGNTGVMTNQASSDLVYSSVLPDQSFLTGVNSAYNFIAFDGTNEYIKNESYTAHQQDTGTISVWVKFGDISGYQYVVGVGGNTSTGTNRVITLLNENLRFSGYSADFDTGADVSADTWYHIVLIWNGTSVTFYLDGTAYTNTQSNLVTPTGTNFVVGAYPAGFSAPTNGDFGTVAHWNKILTSTEVNAIKDLGRHGNLLDSYSDNLKLCYFMSGLDASTGLSDVGNGTIYDRSSQSNHGTATNTASTDLKSSPNAQPNGYAKGDTNRSTTIP